ncbi:class IIb bacteriocin, lactobin A/cerein 7B family [Mycoplasmatota bacterium]|nr:class IIb bacteriocin, lactobin A/cerein 7B family [Mycoplasmatota bacterium]
MTYAMTLDNSWELMTEDEMYDVNGGYYIANSAINTLVAFAGGAALTTTGKVGYVKLGTAFASMFVWVFGIPGIGPLLALYIGANTAHFGAKLADAFLQGKGLDIGLKWYGLKLTVK